MHGLETKLTPWQLSKLNYPTWCKIYMDHPLDGQQTDRCFPLLIVLILEGVTRIPLTPKEGMGFDGKPQPRASLVVAYDDSFRLFITSTRACQEDLRAKCGMDVRLPMPPSCPAEAYARNESGRAAAGGGEQKRVLTKKRK